MMLELGLSPRGMRKRKGERNTRCVSEEARLKRRGDRKRSYCVCESC